MIRLLLHSADRALQGLLASTLGNDYDVRVESDPEQVKADLAAQRADVLILDLDLDHPLDQTLAYISELRGHGTPIVAMTEDDSRSTAMALVQHGVYDYFRKPPHLVELKLVVRRAHEHARLHRTLELAREQLRGLTSCDQLIGSCGRMRMVYDLIRRVANLNTFVLIQGESGTGKELVARAVHNLGREKAPFVAVSCGAIPETLIEAELFGHEKGAFTGAAGVREGYLEKAAGGTLFLDEIGELSLQTQVKLLRVLQERQFSRLGSSKLIPLEARVLFATHRDLEAMVDEGKFRQDLYFRINVLKIEAPPLRERAEDIPALASHFLEIHSRACGRPEPSISPSALDLLGAYHWPGNVRELENVMHRTAILAEGNTIYPEDLPESLRPLDHSLAAEEAASDASFEEQLRVYKHKLVSKAISESNGNKTLAARKLSITRAYLHRLLRVGGEGVDVPVET